MTGTWDKNIELIKRCHNGDTSAEEELVAANAGLVRSIAERFLGRGAELDDLIQLGMIGMVRAIRTFDTERGCAFSTYAVPLIMGEIRRFLRDDGIIKVSREKKRLGSRLLSERERILSETGDEPALSALADICGVDICEAAEALSCVSPVMSISEPIYEDSDMTLSDTIPTDEGTEDETERIALYEVTSSMPPVWRKIVSLRYYHDMSQEATARVLGLTQVKISRKEKKIFEYMREKLS
ncbi:MAG: sigma-70 family RNA polymerase sigma factor [Firmicutes bacterium]|nr:sigma-70 family RNA polymerase sigma factor [Bacillota bacterium]